MNKFFSLAILLIIVTNSSAQNTKNKYDDLIGKTYTNINEINQFKSYNQFEGIVIEDDKSLIGSFNMLSNGNNTVVLFTKLIQQKEFKIFAILEIEKFKKNSKLIMSRCRINSKNDGYIIALVKPADTEYHKSIIKAWRLNIKANQFKEINIKGIDCVNEDYGL